jgi:hypothetical protein
MDLGSCSLERSCWVGSAKRTIASSPGWAPDAPAGASGVPPKVFTHVPGCSPDGNAAAFPAIRAAVPQAQLTSLFAWFDVRWSF